MSVLSKILSFLTFLIIFSCSSQVNDTGDNVQKTANVSLPSVEDTLKYGGDTLSIDRSVEYIMGHFEPDTHPSFELIESKYADRAGMYLRSDAYHAFKRMYEAALQDSIELVIRSATRNFNYQKGIWERKWSGQTTLEGGIKATSIEDPTNRALEILRYSSMPGSSRHHWGTDIDLNAFSNAYFEQGQGLKLFNWLTKHGSTYGFCRPYTEKNAERPDGYQEEKWHWSYWPVSSQLLNAAEDVLRDSMITGFMGADQAPKIKVVDKYVHGVNMQCKLN